MSSVRRGGAKKVMLNAKPGHESLVKQRFKVDIVFAKAKGTYLFQVLYTVRVIDLNALRVLVSLPRSLLRNAYKLIINNKKLYIISKN